MEKKGLFVGIAAMVLAFGVLFTGCDTGNGGGDTGNKNSIIIKSVSPNSGLTNGQETTFTISVDYDLTTQEQGVIDICFNNGDNIDHFFVEDTMQITKEGGSHIFITSVIVKNWGSQGDFCVGAYLSPYPKGEGTKSLASDKRVLTF